MVHADAGHHSTVFTAQAGPRRVRRSQHLLVRRGDLLTGRVAGAGGTVDEGVARDQTTLAAVWPSSTWTIIAVSARAEPSSAPYFPLAPERESEPSTRMSCDPLSTSSGRSVPQGGVDVDALQVPVEGDVRVSGPGTPDDDQGGE